MRFAEPLWLLLIPPTLILGWIAFYYISRWQAALTYPGSEELREVSQDASSLWRTLPYLLKTAAILLGVLAMARPQTIKSEFGAVTHGVDIMIALDTSTSMFAIDFDPMNRISAAKETAKRFIQGRTNDRIGLLVFGGSPILACPLTMDYAALFDYLDGVDAGMTQTDGTAIGDGLIAAVDHLRSSRAKSKVIILLTDGANNTGAIDPVTAAKTAASYGIKIYAIGTAKRGEAYIPVETPFGRQLQRIPDELNEDELLQIANATDGKYFRATSYKELSSIFSEINQLEKTDTRKPTIVSYHDLYFWLIAPALLLLLGEMALSRTLLLRIP